MYSIPLNCTLKMVKINFMLCGFYHNKKFLNNDVGILVQKGVHNLKQRTSYKQHVSMVLFLYKYICINKKSRRAFSKFVRAVFGKWWIMDDFLLLHFCNF